MNAAVIPEQPIVLERFENGMRIELSPVTGLPVLVAPPGTPLLTSERVNALLNESP
jgi:hypothetical protein